MSRQALPLYADDVSAFVRVLKRELAQPEQGANAAGQLTRWPGKFGHRMMCLWVFWSRIDAKRVYSAPEINRTLEAQHLFGDHALLRCEMCDRGLMTRTPDGHEYRRVEQAPPVNALALSRHLTARGAE